MVHSLITSKEKVDTSRRDFILKMLGAAAAVTLCTEGLSACATAPKRRKIDIVSVRGKTKVPVPAEDLTIPSVRPKLIEPRLRRTLENWPVLDEEGEMRDYGLPGAPVCKETAGCRTGILNYLHYLNIGRKPVLLTFGSRGCIGCVDELDLLNAIHDKFGDKLFVVAVFFVQPVDSDFFPSDLAHTKDRMIEKDVRFPWRLDIDPWHSESRSIFNLIENPNSIPRNVLLTRNKKGDLETVYHCTGIGRNTEKGDTLTPFMGALAEVLDL